MSVLVDGGGEASHVWHPPSISQTVRLASHCKVRPKHSCDIEAFSRTNFRADKLMVSAEAAPLFEIQQIWIGTSEQMTQATSIFSPSTTENIPSETPTKIRLKVRNCSKRWATFNGAFSGAFVARDFRLVALSMEPRYSLRFFEIVQVSLDHIPQFVSPVAASVLVETSTHPGPSWSHPSPTTSVRLLLRNTSRRALRLHAVLTVDIKK